VAKLWSFSVPGVTLPEPLALCDMTATNLMKIHTEATDRLRNAVGFSGMVLSDEELRGFKPAPPGRG
jgi:hypothetical protein